MTKVYLKVYFPFKPIFKHHSFSIEFPRKMRNTVLAVQPDSFPKIRRIGTKIESSPTCSTELFQSSGIFQVGSIFGGRTRISSRHCSRPGKSINAAPDLYTVPWKEGFRCLSPRDTIQLPLDRASTLLSKPSPSKA